MNHAFSSGDAEHLASQLIIDESNLIDIEEIAKVFGCTEHSVVVMLRSGTLPGVKFGRDWRIPRSAFWQRVNELALEDAEERREQQRALGDMAGHSMPVVVEPRRPGRPRKHY